MDGIQGMHGAYMYANQTQHVPLHEATVSASKPITPEPEPEHETQVLAEMQVISQVFGTRLEYRYHDTLKQVVVKVIDSESDTVIKELPSAELQAVHVRLRESLGLLVDKKV